MYQKPKIIDFYIIIMSRASLPEQAVFDNVHILNRYVNELCSD